MPDITKKIVLISSGQPALNPRLVKEADALSGAGFRVTVIYAYWNNWGDKLTKSLLATKKWKAVCAGGHPTQNPFTYSLSRLIFKIARNKFKSKLFQDASIARCTPFLIREAKKHKADLYIAHNLGALPAAIKAAKKYRAKCGFDAEDFHRMELNDDTNSISYLIAKSAEDKYFPHLDYITASSPEITAAYRQLYPQKQFHIILNAFISSEIDDVEEHRPVNKIGLFWFSQVIGRQRGLQDVIEALNNLPGHQYQLYLMGKISDEDKSYFKGLAKGSFIHFMAPVGPDGIISVGAQFDIGLALEPGFSTNNRKALSNKLFSYLQSGLAIIATETEAQYNFISANPEIGRTYQSGDIRALTQILNQWQQNRDLIKQMRWSSLTAGTYKYNWETEGQKFLKLVNETINAN